MDEMSGHIDRRGDDGLIISAMSLARGGIEETVRRELSALGRDGTTKTRLYVAYLGEQRARSAQQLTAMNASKMMLMDCVLDLAPPPVTFFILTQLYKSWFTVLNIKRAIFTARENWNAGKELILKI